MHPHDLTRPRRRQFTQASGAALAALAWPALATSKRTITGMTDGPFYPPRAWREQWTDWDADLSRVQRAGRTLVARGEHLGLELQLTDANGRIVDGAEVEIWQCDVLAAYRHPGVRLVAGQYDEAFQGFGASRSERDGRLRFRSIKPVPYPGRTPHIHIKLRHASFGERHFAVVHRRRQRQCARFPVARGGRGGAADAGDEPAACSRRQRPALAGAACAGAAGLSPRRQPKSPAGREMCEASR